MTGLKRDPREVMNLAVQVMTDSVPEPRTDGKASPKVGAVLIRDGSTLETACRGELRLGDHAEYTLLERRHRGTRLDGAILFTTLEPCAPGSRRHPKLSCAERIVLARIKEVWVGIEDPDPTVDRRGIKYLQDHGVTVHMFDRDVQEIIRERNWDFIEQAEERAAAARTATPAEPPPLSHFEAPISGASLADLHPGALEAYRKTVGLADAVGTDAFYGRLAQQGLVQSLGGRVVPTGFGLVLFGKEPRIRLPQAALLGTLHLESGREETRDFDGPAVLVPQLALDWLRDRLPNPIDRTRAVRREANDAIFEMLREGLANALVHRDYGIEGAKCQLDVSPGEITVLSPGAPVEPITIEQLRAFDAPMLSRNPILHFVFAKMRLAEERGLGLKSLRSRAAAAGLPLPTYSYRAPYVVLSLRLTAEAAVRSAGLDSLAALSPGEQVGWRWIVSRGTATAAEYEQALGVPRRTARYQLNQLVNLGLLLKVNKGRATRYEVAP